jgi:uncharacterized protein (DUF302 family)
MCGSKPRHDVALIPGVDAFASARAVVRGSVEPSMRLRMCPSLVGMLAATIFGICFWGASAMAADGLITIASSFGAKDTADRLESEITARGLTVFARIDHAAGATQVGLSLRPTEVLIFGNAKGGTPLMQSDQRVGIDLPLKALVWEDADGNTWLSYNDPKWIATRYGLGDDTSRVVDTLSAALAGVARAATERP